MLRLNHHEISTCWLHPFHRSIIIATHEFLLLLHHWMHHLETTFVIVNSLPQLQKLSSMSSIIKTGKSGLTKSIKIFLLIFQSDKGPSIHFITCTQPSQILILSVFMSKYPELVVFGEWLKYSAEYLDEFLSFRTLSLLIYYKLWSMVSSKWVLCPCQTLILHLN